MYHALQDFIADWQIESGKTERIFAVITNAALEQRVTPNGRTARTLAWHIVSSLSEMMGRVGLQLEGPNEDAPEPSSAEDILAGYRGLAASLIAQAEGAWTDESLTNEYDMYGQKWSLRQTLQVLIRHEIHHRAQLTVLLRQAGVKVPGIYGPSLEEWSDIGMEPMP
jgi:uncharacterized damage-inducible protein DinB